MINSMDKERFVVGMKQTLGMIGEDELARVFIALDADAFVTREVIEAAEEKNIPISYVESMKRLGRQCGIDIGASCAGVLWSIGDPQVQQKGCGSSAKNE